MTMNFVVVVGGGPIQPITVSEQRHPDHDCLLPTFCGESPFKNALRFRNAKLLTNLGYLGELGRSET